MDANFFSAESAIIARLMEAVPQLKSAYGLGAMARNLEPNKRPSAAVAYDGYEPLGRGSGKALLRQKWRIVLLVDSINDKTGALARARAGLFTAGIISALGGWRPSLEHSPMELAPGGSGDYQDGFAAFHLIFTTNITI